MRSRYPEPEVKRSRYPVYAFQKCFLYDKTNGLWSESKLTWQHGQAQPDSGNWGLRQHWIWNTIAAQFANRLYIKALQEILD